MGLRTSTITSHPVVKRAAALLSAMEAAKCSQVAVRWQKLTEGAEIFTARMASERARLPSTTLLVAVCMPGSIQPAPGVCVIEIPAKCYRVLRPAARARFRVLRGGRGAAKSWSIARVLIAMALERPISVLACREIQHSIRASTHRLLSRQIAGLGLSRYFEIDVRAIRSYCGSTFDFEGLFQNVDRIKSYEGINVCWIEEAHSISADSWEILEPTLREAGSFFMVNYNPDDASAPTHTMFAVAPRPDALVEHVTYRDNPYLTEPLRQAMEYLRSVDMDAYQHVWEGQPRSHSDAQILKGKVVCEEFEPSPSWSGPHLGLDFGFSQDPTAGVRLYVDETERVLYVWKECWALGCDIDATPALLDQLGADARQYVMRADSARPESISYLARHGYPNITATAKWSGSVEDGVSFLRSFTRIVIHPSCEHAQEESKLYSYKTDRLSGDVLPDIQDKHNHIWDAARYALAPLIQGVGSGFMSYYADMLAASNTAPAAPASAWAPAAPTMSERVKASGAVAQDLTAWHQK
jgi:phage terminase large subunit